MILQRMIEGMDARTDDDRFTIDAIDWAYRQGLEQLEVHFDNLKQDTDKNFVPSVEMIVRLPNCVVSVFDYCVSSLDDSVSYSFADLIDCLKFAYALYQLGITKLVPPLSEETLATCKRLEYTICNPHFSIGDFKDELFKIAEDYSGLPF